MIIAKADSLGAAAAYPPLSFYENWFQDYTAAFLNGSPEQEANIRIKIHHSLRVLALAQEITAGLELSPEAAALAHLAALLHDVGRFPQYQRHGTFRDQVSVNHGLEGVRTLKREQVLAGLPPAAQRAVLIAVGLHNRRQLPPGLSGAAKILTQIVRDADKLDIIAVMVQHFHPQAPYNKVVNAGLQPHPTAYTPAILEQVRRRRQVDYNGMVWLNDFKLLLCSWLYDFNFPVSLRLLQGKGHFGTLLESLPATSEFSSLRRQLLHDLQDGGATAPFCQ